MTDVTTTGPLFDGRLERAIATGTDDARHQVANLGVAEVRVQLGRVLRHPTGNYQRHIAVRRTGIADVVHDSGVVYGPWLAGVSQRNQSTRFKGYAHWRRALQALQRRAVAVASKVIDERIRRLG